MTGNPLAPRVPAALSKLLYLTAAVILIDQAAILAAAIYPLSPSLVQWRFGAVGLAAGRATPLLLGDLLLLLGAFTSGHRVVLRAIAVAHVLVALGVLALLVLFSLDTLEVRHLIPLDGRGQTLASAIRAAAALVVVGVWGIWTAVLIIRATPSPPAARSADRRIVVDTHSAGAV